MAMNLVQYINEKGRRAVAVAAGDGLHAVKSVSSTVELAKRALKERKKLAKLAKDLSSERPESYAAALKEKRVLPPVTHDDLAHCIITGTGLTHLGSASARDSMHKKLDGGAEALTDSLKMFKMGLEGGRPKKGTAGVQPEWFYKGDGRWLVAPGAALPKPSFALDGGEEPEVAGLYLIDASGKPVRLGFALGNEYSDHVTERQNYLFLAHSKLRHCAIGPEMITGPLPSHVEGTSRINRGGKIIWQKPFLTGESNMSHTLENLEYHHFKYDAFRVPGDVHIHFFGTATLSIADGVSTQNGDVFEIEAAPFGAPLRNTLKEMKPGFKPGGVREG
jgi:hypothetical protein